MMRQDSDDLHQVRLTVTGIAFRRLLEDRQERG
jgi:hypothetical protein